MGQKHIAEFWQWVAGRDEVGPDFPGSIDTAITKLEESLHDLRLVKHELELIRNKE